MSTTNPFKYFLLVLIISTVFLSCSKDSDIASDLGEDNVNESSIDSDLSDDLEEDNVNEFSIKSYSFTGENSDLMFQDGEPQAVMTAENRRYSIAKVLRINAVDAFTFEIANFTPVDMKNVSILATIDGLDKEIKLFNIDTISAFAIKKVRYSFLDESTQFTSIDDTMIDLSEFKEFGIATDKISFDFIGESVFIQKLKKLEILNWEVKFHDFDPNDNPNNNWIENLTPKDVRQYTGLMINYGALIASDEFHEGFLAETIIGNDGGEPLSVGAKEQVYQNLIGKGFFKLGRVVNVSGLGGGGTLGVAGHILRRYIDPAENDGQYLIVSHEFGHILGFNHSSTMTYPKNVNGVNVGIQPLTARIRRLFNMENRHPVTKENYVNISDFN